MSHQIQLADVGTRLFLATGIDVTGATTREIKCRAPSGATKTLAAVVDTQIAPGGKPEVGISRITQAADFDEAGTWQIQAHVVMPSGFDGHGLETDLIVGTVIV